MMDRRVDSEVERLGLFIDGARRDSQSDESFDVVNPSNGRCCLSLPAGCVADVDQAVVSARVAFDDGRWSMAPVSQKKRILHQLADLVSSKASIFDEWDAEEMGKPVSEPRFNAAAAAGLLRFYAEAVDKLTGDTYTSDKQNFVVRRQVPRGVVAAIVPWNFPTYNAVLKCAAALAAGNCVVLKPSELSSRSSLFLADLAVDVGLPHGVLNVVTGRGGTAGRALGLHRDVDMVTFTGSSATGKKMLEYSAQSNMKVVLAECGGKSPQIVFADGVELDAAAASIAQMLLTNQGQICSVGSRLLVEKSIEKPLVERIVALCDNVVIGAALDPATTFGPVASSSQLSRVMRYVDNALADGATLIKGGSRVRQETGGFFVQPTIFKDVNPAAEVAQEEVFGPLLCVTAFDSEAQAVSIANGTRYGLAAYVWTADLSRGMRMSNSIRSSVRVYAAAPQGEGAGYATSIEPYGESGIGVEGGLMGMQSYMRSQRVWVSHA